MEKRRSPKYRNQARQIRFVQLGATLAVVLAVVFQAVPVSLACGPGYIEPVFVFDRSPDIPFEQYTGGKLGIVRPTFGRKALVIGYRYLTGGGFNSIEQKQLVEALNGKPPEESNEQETVKAWLEARKAIVPDEKASEIYTERATYSGYNFFPNCTANAFDVAAKTLRERVQSHGSDDGYVREWLKGQDAVFAICSSKSEIPADVHAHSPEWFRKDRAYQIAAAYFYALKFDEARKRFEEIAADGDSVWRETAEYLIGRTLVRQGSLIKDEAKKQVAYEEAERELSAVAGKGGRYAEAAEQLINLVKYRIHPKERLAELSRTLSYYPGNRNLRQDLIDYVWLFDKFESEAGKAIEEQKKREREEEAARTGNANIANANKGYIDGDTRSKWEIEREALEKGEIITISFSYPVPGQTYPAWVSNPFPFDANDEQILETFARQAGHELNADETKKILESKASALKQRDYYLSSNYRYSQEREGGYEGGQFSYDTEITTAAFPSFMREDDLTDWIATFQINDELAFKRASAKYFETRTYPWLIAALAKAKKDSPDIEKLITAAAKIELSSPAFPTVTYHVARLKIEQGKDAEASKMLDELIASGIREYPVSAQNLILELRLRVAKTLDEFLRFAGRKPAAFNNSGYEYGSLRDFFETEKGYWNKEYNKESREEYIRDLEKEYAEILPWDDRTIFDDRTIDIFNRHFSTDLLAQAALSKELPGHLRPKMVLTVWTRAVLLGRTDISTRFAEEAGRANPDMAETFRRYLSIKGPVAKRNEELWILLKNPKLSAFVTGGIPERGENEISSWDDGWWAEPSHTYYDDRGNELPKSTVRPLFVTESQSSDAQAELRRISAAGDAEAYLTKRVFEWARLAPRDSRIPEALATVAIINLMTKYGDGDEGSRKKAIKLLETRYPGSPWIAKAKDEGY